MKKEKDGTAPEWRYYPHIIRQGPACNTRHDLHITNEPLPEDRIHWHAAYAFWRAGAVDEDGRVTAIGRQAIVDGLRSAMRADDEICVVWAPRDCTYLTRRGTIDSADPPHGQPQDTAAITRLYNLDYEGAALRLPKGCRASHLFIRRLAHDRVEIATAAPAKLYDREEPVRPGEIDPVAGCYDRNGGFRAPFRMMGVEVAGEDDGWILGPVQPDGVDRRVVTAWPSAVAAACIELAERPLDAALVQAVWRAAESLPQPPIVCGVHMIN